MDEYFPLPGPRLRGVKEHHDRARWFLKHALEVDGNEARFRCRMAALYFARGAVEIMLEAAERQELEEYRDNNREERRKLYEETLVPALPYYKLIEKIRIHDFHRFGCTAPDPELSQVFLGGPFKLTANKGEAPIRVMKSGPPVTTTGDPSFKDQRSLCSRDGRFFDEESEQYVSLEKILEEFLEGLSAAIGKFEGLMGGDRKPRS